MIFLLFFSNKDTTSVWSQHETKKGQHTLLVVWHMLKHHCFPILAISHSHTASVLRHSKLQWSAQKLRWRPCFLQVKNYMLCSWCVCCTLFMPQYTKHYFTHYSKEYTKCTISGPVTDLLRCQSKTFCFSKVKHCFKWPHIQARI